MATRRKRSAVTAEGGSAGKHPRVAQPGAALHGDVLLATLAFLGAADLARCSRVCRHWRDVARRDALWRPVCEAELGRGALAVAATRWCDAYAGLVGNWRGALVTARPLPSRLHADKAVRALAFVSDAEAPALLSAGQDCQLVVNRWPLATPSLGAAWEPERPSSLNCVDAFAPGLCAAGQSMPHAQATLLRLEFDGAALRPELQALRVFSGHVDSVFACRADLSASLLATGGGQNDKRVLLHNLETGALEARLEHRGSVRGLWLSERLLLSACLDKRVRFFDRRSRECEFELVAHGAGVHAVQAREHLVVSVCGRPENGVRVWDMRRLPSGASSATSGTHPALLAECDAAHRSAVSCLAWDGLRLLTGSYDGHVRLWTLGATSLRACGAPIPLGADVHAVCLAGAAAVAGEESGAVHVLDFAPRARAK